MVIFKYISNDHLVILHIYPLINNRQVISIDKLYASDNVDVVRSVTHELHCVYLNAVFQYCIDRQFDFVSYFVSYTDSPIFLQIRISIKDFYFDINISNTHICFGLSADELDGEFDSSGYVVFDGERLFWNMVIVDADLDNMFKTIDELVSIIDDINDAYYKENVSEFDDRY
jgi:hypothetical protein